MTRHSSETMSKAEVEAVLQQVANGAITARTAISLLVMKGQERDEVNRQVFYALGGDDRTVLDECGRARYARSRRLVTDVEQAITEANEP